MWWRRWHWFHRWLHFKVDQKWPDEESPIFPFMGFLFEFFFSQNFPLRCIDGFNIFRALSFSAHGVGFAKFPLSFLCDIRASQNSSISHFHFCREIIVTMPCVMPSTNGPSDYIKKMYKKRQEFFEFQCKGFHNTNEHGGP